MLRISKGPFEIKEDSITIHIDRLSLLTVSLLCLLGIISLSALSTNGIEVPLIQEILAIVFLTFIPGTFAILLLDISDRGIATTICYVFGLSIFIVMLVGGVISIVMPIFGVNNPFSLNFLVGVWALLTSAATLFIHNKLSFSVEFDKITNPRTLFLLLLPLVSIIGSALYEVSGSNQVLLGLLLAIALIPVFAVTVDRERWYFPLAIWCISLALLYHGRVFEYYTFTQPLPQITLENGRWIPNYGGGRGSLLANGVLFPIYSILTGLPIEVEWNLVNPILVSFLPVALYETFHRHVGQRDALISACLFMFAYPFYVLYPGAGRAATPVIFLSLLGLAYSDESLPGHVKQFLLLVFAFGVAVTHYGTAYVVMFALLTSGVIFIFLRLLVQSKTPIRAIARDSLLSKESQKSRFPNLDIKFETTGIIRPVFLAYYSAFALGWYLFTANGVKFGILPRKVIAAVSGVLYGDISGSTAHTIQENFASVVITSAKYLYIIFGLLMGIGIAAAVFKLVNDREEVVHTGYLAISAGFFSMFIGSALPSGRAFAVARVMMIIFTFAVPFVVVGARTIKNILASIGALIYKNQNWVNAVSSRSALAVVIAVFLLLNSGFVAETVTDGYSPSNRVSQERLLESDNSDFRLRVRDCEACDIQTHLWVFNQIQSDHPIYSGRIAAIQQDFYGGSLRQGSSSFLHYTEIERNQTEIPQDSSLILLKHNSELQGFSIGYKFNFYRRDMTEFTRGNRIYTNGHGEVLNNPMLNNTAVN